MSGLARTLKPVDDGWASRLPDGRELAHSTGANAKQRAPRYVDTHNLAKEAAAHGGGRKATRSC